MDIEINIKSLDFDDFKSDYNCYKIEYNDLKIWGMMPKNYTIKEILTHLGKYLPNGR